MAGKRKIVKPPEPPQNPAHVAGPNGCRGHYEATIYTVIVEGINGPENHVPPNPQVHFKELKGRSGQPSELPVTLAKLEVVNTELFGFLSGASRRSRGYLVVDPADRSKIVGIATEQIDNFKDYKRNPDPQFWDQFEIEDVARAGMRIAIMADDDNHKENLGKVEPPDIAPEQKRPLRVIDHDMCFYDQIFSRVGKGSRNYLHPFSENRTYLSSADIDNFPNTSDFRPHYWWSKPGLRKKSYKSYDKQAMAEFARDEGAEGEKGRRFKKAAYSQLFSFLLTPKALFETMLLQHIDRNDPLFPLVINAWIEQQCTLRTAALGSKKFCAAVAANSEEYQRQFVQLVADYNAGIAVFTNEAVPAFGADELDTLCNNFISTTLTSQAAKDTPLHAAIRSGHFRYDETMKSHGKDLHNKNGVPQGIQQTPLDLAIALGVAAAEQAEAALPANPRPEAEDAPPANPAEAKAQWDKVIYFQRVARFLVNQGAVKPVNYSTFLNLHRPPTPALQNLLSLHDQLQDRVHKTSYTNLTDEISREDVLGAWVDALSSREHSKVPVVLKHWNDANLFVNLEAQKKDPTLTEKDRQIFEKVAHETHSNLVLDALELSLAKLRDNTDLTLKMKKNTAILAFKTVLPLLHPLSYYAPLEDRYELLLMQLLPEGEEPKAGQIYINAGTGEYTMLGTDNRVKRGTLPLEIDRVNLANNLNNIEFKKQVLAHTSQLGHTRAPQDDFERIINILNKDEFKFLQQLTSRLEIVRRFRGLYGVTSTYKTIAHAINKQLNKLADPLPLKNQQEAVAQPGDAQLPAVRAPVDKTFIMHLQIKCSEKMHTFFARHTKLVRQLKFPETREVKEELSAPAA
jgi:hypothetical protein